MYFSPMMIFIIVALFVGANLVLYGASLLPAFLVWRIGKNRKWAARLAIASLALVAFGIPGLSYLKARWQYWQVARHDVSLTVPQRPEHVSLIKVYDTRMSLLHEPLADAPCDIQCQGLLLSKEVATVNVTLLVQGGARYSASVNYSLEHGGECFVDGLSDTPEGVNMPELLNATIFAAAQGECIVARQGQDLPSATKVFVGSGGQEGRASTRFAEIQDASARTLYRDTALSAKVLPPPLFIAIDRVNYDEKEFGNWTQLYDSSAVMSNLLKVELGFSLAPLERYRNAHLRETVEHFLASRTQEKFPSLMNRTFAGYCGRLTANGRSDLGTVDEQFISLRRILSDGRVSRFTKDDCQHQATNFFYSHIPQAISYAEQTLVRTSDGAAENGLFSPALNALRHGITDRLKESAPAYFKLATGERAERFYQLWTRLGMITDQDPSSFLLEKAAANNSHSAEAIVGICDADPKWAPSFMPELEDVLQKLDIFTANSNSEPSASVIAGAGALARNGDKAAGDRLLARLRDDIALKARKSVQRIVENIESDERPCYRYSTL